MNTPYGIQGTIDSKVSLEGLDETLTYGDFTLSVKENVVCIGFQREDQEEEAHRKADLWIKSWKFRHRFRGKIAFNQSWRPGPTGNRAFTVTLSATAMAGASLSVVGQIIDKDGNIVEIQPAHPYSVEVTQDLFAKAAKDEELARAIGYFTDEVIDDDRPLYGIYKALEVLADKLAMQPGVSDGWKQLARLANKTNDYALHVRQTAQRERHADDPARRMLSDDECTTHAWVLIEAYARSV